MKACEMASTLGVVKALFDSDCKDLVNATFSGGLMWVGEVPLR